MRRLLLAALLLFPLGLAAQTYPDQTDPHLVDLGEMLSDQEEGTLRTQLTRLAEEDDTEMVVVTLPSVAEVAGTLTVQEYAEGLFEDWGVGTAEANTGVLMVVFAEDRELYIALGQDYDGAWNGLTAGIIQFRIIPAFRDDNYALGISNGIDAVQDMIVRPFRADAPVPEPITEAAPAAAPAEGEGGGGGRTGLYIFGGIIVAVGALIARAVSKNKARLAGMECPACGHKGMEERTEVVREATEETEGERAVITKCPSCGNETARTSAIPRKTPQEDPEKGKAGGGGAGGTW